MEEFDSQAISLFDEDSSENESPLVPWGMERLASEGVSSYVKDRAHNKAKELEEAYSYEASISGDGKIRFPSLEKVASDRRKFFAREDVQKVDETRGNQEVEEAKQEELERSSTAMREGRLRKRQPRTVATKKKIINNRREKENENKKNKETPQSSLEN